jgi:hypothetical protein
MSQCGQRASFNRDRDLAGDPHWCSSGFGCRNACGVADRIDIVEVDDILEMAQIRPVKKESNHEQHT